MSSIYSLRRAEAMRSRRSAPVAPVAPVAFAPRASRGPVHVAAPALRVTVPAPSARATDPIAVAFAEFKTKAKWIGGDVASMDERALAAHIAKLEATQASVLRSTEKLGKLAEARYPDMKDDAVFGALERDGLFACAEFEEALSDIQNAKNSLVAARSQLKKTPAAGKSAARAWHAPPAQGWSSPSSPKSADAAPVSDPRVNTTRRPR